MKKTTKSKKHHSSENPLQDELNYYIKQKEVDNQEIMSLREENSQLKKTNETSIKQVETYGWKYSDSLEEMVQLRKEMIELTEQQLRLNKENKTLREMFSQPSIPEGALSCLQNMIADDAFKKMVKQYRILKSLIVPFFLMFQDFGEVAEIEQYQRIIDDSYDFSQTMLKVLDEFGDRFYPIIELAEIRLLKEIKQNV
jgi:uncharacterized membrane protein YgaE (UPF0421/DUF939 family)